MRRALETYSLFPSNEQSKKREKRVRNGFQNEEEANKVWTQCLDIIKDNLSEPTFQTWFSPTKALSYSDEELVVKVPSQFYYEWIDSHYSDLLKQTINKIVGNDIKLSYQVIVEESDTEVEKRSMKLPGFKIQNQPLPQGKIEFEKPDIISSEFINSFNPRYTFDNFIRGECNQMAASAALAVAENPRSGRYNPLFIYGDSGLGKTHLAQAIGNNILRKNARSRCLYVTSEDFTMQFIKSLQEQKGNEFTTMCRNADVLIIEDVQFFTGKEKTLDNFFHTFNALHQAGKQIILTSDRAPKDLQGVDERLISRFQWGLIVDVQAPDLETRMAILQKKSADEGVELSMEITEYMARHITQSVRELEGALISLLFKTTLDKHELSLDLAKEVVMGVARTAPIKLAVEEIKNVVSEYYNVPIPTIMSNNRTATVALARQMCMFLAKETTDLTLKNIAESFNRKDHTTVIHAIKTIQNYIDVDKSVAQAYQAIKKRLM